MREIKFRLIKDNKIVGYEIWTKHELDYCWLYGDKSDDICWVIAMSEHDQKNQYTGLKDKNGKEIYEGDIVKDDIGNRLVKIGFSYFFDPDGIEHNFYGVYGIWDDKTESYFKKDDNDLEIIGNIYENPELLK